MKKILIVGQTPPPYHGQSIMIEKMLSGDYGDIELIHVRMGFSRDLDEVGRLNLKKVFELFVIIGRIILPIRLPKINFFPGMLPALYILMLAIKRITIATNVIIAAITSKMSKSKGIPISCIIFLYSECSLFKIIFPIYNANI